MPFWPFILDLLMADTQAHLKAHGETLSHGLENAVGLHLGSVDEARRLRNEYLMTENRMIFSCKVTSASILDFVLWRIRPSGIAFGVCSCRYTPLKSGSQEATCCPVDSD